MPTLYFPLACMRHAKCCDEWAESMKLAQEMEKMALIDNRKAMCVVSSVIPCTQSMYSIMEQVTALGSADELSTLLTHSWKTEKPSIYQGNVSLYSQNVYLSCARSTILVLRFLVSTSTSFHLYWLYVSYSLQISFWHFYY